MKKNLFSENSFGGPEKDRSMFGFAVGDLI